MSKEFMIAQQSLEYGERERLRIENIQDLARMAAIQLSGEETPPDLLPLERHLSTCEFCRDDIDYLKDSMNAENQARLYFFEDEAFDSTQRQIQEDWMWGNRFSD